MDLTEILETVARDGLPGPRDLDVAIDAITACYVDDVLTEKGFDELADLIEGLGDSAPYTLPRSERDALVDMINDIYLRN